MLQAEPFPTWLCDKPVRFTFMHKRLSFQSHTKRALPRSVTPSLGRTAALKAASLPIAPKSPQPPFLPLQEDWADVRAEMVEEKGLSPEAADKIEPFVRLKGEPLALLQELQGPSSGFSGHAAAQEALADLALLFQYLQAMGALKRISFDLRCVLVRRFAAEVPFASPLGDRF